MPLREVCHKGSQLQPEHSRNQIQPVSRGLSAQEVASDLRPIRVARHRDEEVGLPIGAHRRHSVLVPPMHVPRAPNVGGRQHHGHPDVRRLLADSVLPLHGVTEASVEFPTDFILLGADKH